MASLNQVFDAAELTKDSRGNFDPLPAGFYQVTINGAEIKTTKAGNGQFISVRYDVLGPTHQGRVVFANINIKNPNPEAEKIGRAELGNLLLAIGMPTIEDTDQLLGKSLQIKLAVKQSEQYGEQNEVKGFKALGGAMPTLSRDAGLEANQPTTQAKAAPPWAKR